MAFQTRRVQHPPSQNEIHFHLYMHQTHGGPAHRNQARILDPNLRNSFGSITVHDWELYDGFGNHAKVIARAQGLHMQTAVGSHQSWFKGSTLQVMGPVVSGGEWAIVGGTGEFPLAQGVIYKKLLPERSNSNTNIVELHIHAFCTPNQWHYK